MSKHRTPKKQPLKTKASQSGAKNGTPQKPIPSVLKPKRIFSAFPKWIVPVGLIGSILLILVVWTSVPGLGIAILATATFKPPIYTATPYLTGAVSCAKTSPAFVAAIGFSRAAALDTRALYVKGVALRELDSNGNITRSYQHPSWSQAGYLGQFATDRAGNIYLAPLPVINILENPPEKSNLLYRINAATGVMSPFIDLPTAAPLNPNNSYGILGIAYDCNSNSLYISSVCGSTPDAQRGRIYRVDLNTQRVASILDNVDAYALATFNAVGGKRLYFGSARTSEVRSIPLDAAGNFGNDTRLEISFPNEGVHGSEIVRKMTFKENNSLTLEIAQFDFNLTAPTEALKTGLDYHYDINRDNWSLITSYPIES